MADNTDTDSDTGQVRASRAHRWLAPVSLVIVALAAIMGWAASFVGLHDYGQHDMTGFTVITAWLLPATYDGAAFACTLMTYRASIHGRSALRGRLLMWAFTGVSSWINWIHQPSLDTRLVAAGLPIAAVAVFDVVLAELRADYEAQHERPAFRLRPGLLLLRWLADRHGTTAAFRDQITALPVHELAGLANPAAGPVSDAVTAAKPTPEMAAAVTSVKAGAVKLPAAVLDKLHTAQQAARDEGRAFTTTDVQQTVRVPDEMAARIVAEFATHNGHAFTD